MDEQGEPFGPIKNISDIFPGLPKVCLLPMLKKVLGRVVDVAIYDDNLYTSVNICRNLTLALPGTMGSHLYSKVHTTLSQFQKVEIETNM